MPVQTKPLTATKDTLLSDLAATISAIFTDLVDQLNGISLLILSIGQPNRLLKSWPSARLNLSWLR